MANSPQRLKRITADISRKQMARFEITQLLDREIRVLKERAEEAGQKYFGWEQKLTMGIGMWVCKNSPNGLCWYAADDPDRDDCIICHEPEERK